MKGWATEWFSGGMRIDWGLVYNKETKCMPKEAFWAKCCSPSALSLIYIWWKLPRLIQISCLKTLQRRIKDDSLSRPESPTLPSRGKLQWFVPVNCKAKQDKSDQNFQSKERREYMVRTPHNTLDKIKHTWWFQIFFLSFFKVVEGESQWHRIREK